MKNYIHQLIYLGESEGGGGWGGWGLGEGGGGGGGEVVIEKRLYLSTKSSYVLKKANTASIV